MAKVLLLLLCLLSMSSYSQNEVVSEGFEESWLPEGWSYYQNNVDAEKFWKQSTTGIPVYSGSYSAYVQPSSPVSGTALDWIVSPPFVMQGNMSLDFYRRFLNSTSGASGTYKIGICAADADASDLSNYTILFSNGVPSTNWGHQTIPIMGSQYEAVEKRIAFIYEVAGSVPVNAFIIDDVKIRHSCNVPYNLGVYYSLEDPNPQIAWAVSGGGEFEYEIVPADQEPVGSGIMTNSNYNTITDLAPGAYKFYVRLVCNETYSSVWAGPFYFAAMNRVTGKVRYDLDGDNDCEDNDIPIPGMEMELTIDGQTHSVYTNENGDYAYYYVPEYVSQITFEPHLGTAFPENGPIIREVNFSQHNFAEEVNICLPQPSLYKDLSVSFTPFADPRPGLQSKYLLKIRNNGTDIINTATASIEFNDTKLDFLSASSSYTVSGNLINFPMENILPYATREIIMTFMVMTPPQNIAGETLIFNGNVTPTQDDVLPNDNVFTLKETIVDSFDPNDITVHEGSKIFEEQIDDYLTYTIRFQNTGSADALNIYLENELDNKLDWTTFKPLASSHSYMVTRDGEHVKFTYENINLPHAGADEPGSHGFVTYRIKPKNTAEVGDIIKNQAKIYFDFNEAVITNETATEIIDDLLNIDQDRMADVSLYPNPVKDKINITVPNATIISVCILDMNGRVCLDRLIENNTLNTLELTSGMYIVKVITDKGTSIHKMIKE